MRRGGVGGRKEMKKSKKKDRKAEKLTYIVFEAGVSLGGGVGFRIYDQIALSVKAEEHWRIVPWNNRGSHDSI